MPYHLFYDWLPGFRAIRGPGLLRAPAGRTRGLAGMGIHLGWQHLSKARLLEPNWQFAWVGVLIAGLALVWADTSTTMNLPLPLPVDNPAGLRPSRGAPRDGARNADGRGSSACSRHGPTSSTKH
ncbi:MAG: hypothetical protein R3A46_14195 [Thermomicrobiales bacterium]